MRLMEDYKKNPKESALKAFQWINDDYVKFIRLSQQYITASQIGDVSCITPHGFIETFRIRWKLLSVFDSIYFGCTWKCSKKKKMKIFLGQFSRGKYQYIFRHKTIG